MKMFRSIILLIAVLSVIVFSLAGCGDEGTISIELENGVQTKDGTELIFEIENNTSGNISFGWVNDGEVYVTTSEGTYVCEPDYVKIFKGENKITIDVPDCEGEIEKIVFSKLCLLNDRGLPEGSEITDAVIFDKNAGIDEFEDHFSFTFNLQSSAKLIIVIVPIFIGVIMIVAVIVLIVFAVRRKKKNADSVAQFANFAPPAQYNTYDDNFMPPPPPPSNDF